MKLNKKDVKLVKGSMKGIKMRKDDDHGEEAKDKTKLKDEDYSKLTEQNKYGFTYYYSLNYF